MGDINKRKHITMFRPLAEQLSQMAYDITGKTEKKAQNWPNLGGRGRVGAPGLAVHCITKHNSGESCLSNQIALHEPFSVTSEHEAMHSW